MSTVISVENLSKTYRLGQIGTGTFTHDLSVWWAKMRGKPNPMLKIDEKDHGNRDDEELWALKDVSFKVEQGEVLGIIGRNGAGKSTLLKILSRVTAPTSGRVKIKGRIASLLEVGTGFHPDLSGRENIYLNGAILGMNRKEIDRKFDEIVDFAEVEKFIDTPVKRYSSGMYVRLAFAVAAHLEPEVLVIDEVLAVGDAQFQRKCLGKMGEVAKQGRTILFVSHDLTNISILCAKALLLQAGKISCHDQTNKVVEKYYDLMKNAQSKKAPVARQSIEKREIQITSLYARAFNKQNVQEEFYLSDKIEIVIDYYAPSAKKPSRLNPVIVVKNILGVTLFSSANYENAEWGKKYYDKEGTFRAVCVIPEHILNNGSYIVEAMIVRDMRDVAVKSAKELEFNINDDGSSRGDYIGNWDGLIRPRCVWKGEVV